MERKNGNFHKKSEDIENGDDILRRVVIVLIISFGFFVWAVLFIIWLISILFLYHCFEIPVAPPLFK